MPRTPFKPIIKRSYVNISGFSADRMAMFGNILNNSIRDRFNQGLDMYDNAAPPLSESYIKYKTKGSFGGRRPFPPGEPIRNLRLTGQLQRSMKMKRAQPNKTTIGFADSVSDERMTFNQRRAPMYGASPRDLEKTLKVVEEYRSEFVTISAKRA